MRSTAEAEDELIDRLRTLTIQQEVEINDIRARQHEERSNLVARSLYLRRATRPNVIELVEPTEEATATTRRPFNRFRDRDNIPLAIGDVVELLTTGATGRIGDEATIVKFTDRFVIIILPSRSTTTRSSKNVRKK